MSSTRELGGDLLDGLAVSRPREQQVAHGVGDLAAPAVADGDVDGHPVDVLRALGRGAEARSGLGWQQVEGADDLEVPVPGLGEVGDGRLDDLEERGELLLGAAQVVGREEPERDVLDARLTAPSSSSSILSAPAWWPLRRPGSAGPRPAPVAVEHDGDVPWERLLGEVLEDSALVRAVDHIAPPHGASSSTRSCRRRSRSGQPRAGRGPTVPLVHRRAEAVGGSRSARGFRDEVVRVS